MAYRPHPMWGCVETLISGRTKPKHIRQDHWVSLSKLIVEERKIKEAEKLRENRTQLKRPSISSRDSNEVPTNLVSIGPIAFV